MATAKNLNGTTPAAPANARNAIWQVTSSPSGTDGATGNPVYDASCYLVDMTGDSGTGGSDGLAPAPPAGSAAAGKFLKADGTWAVPGTSGGGSTVKTFSYTGVSGDKGKLLVFNSSSAVTLTLPASIPASNWFILAANIGTGTLMVNPNGLQIDGQAASLSLLGINKQSDQTSENSHARGGAPICS